MCVCARVRVYRETEIETEISYKELAHYQQRLVGPKSAG